MECSHLQFSGNIGASRAHTEMEGPKGSLPHPLREEVGTHSQSAVFLIHLWLNSPWDQGQCSSFCPIITSDLVNGHEPCNDPQVIRMSQIITCNPAELGIKCCTIETKWTCFVQTSSVKKVALDVSAICNVRYQLYLLLIYPEATHCL